jgi:8-oxo-dGTP diphosphatase
MTEDQTPPMSRPRVAAGALFFDDQGRVLLVKPTYKDGWDIPGGYVEPGETPIEACQREVQEELGVECQVERLLVVDWAPSQNEGDKILFVFDGGGIGVDPTRLQLQRDELSEVAFHAPEALTGLMPERLSRRLLAAIDSRATTSPKYLEHGGPPH